MPAPYSEDLRQKALAAVERGERKSDVSRMLNISRNTLDLWLKRKEQTGNCQAITHYQQEIDIKSPIGSNFVSLRNGMEVGLKGKWHSCGEKG